MPDRNRLQALLSVVAFDVAGPLLVNSMLRSRGMAAVPALVLSGTVPAIGVANGVVRRRRLDVVGAMVLIGIAVGVIAGSLSNDARLVLVEGSVPTGVFGLICLLSLWWARPLMFHIALEFIGADTPKGHDFERSWTRRRFQRRFRVVTAVWGIAYLAEAVARVAIVETTSTSTALTVSKAMPYAVAGLLVAGMIVYAQLAKRRVGCAAMATGSLTRVYQALGTSYTSLRSRHITNGATREGY